LGLKKGGSEKDTDYSEKAADNTPSRKFKNGKRRPDLRTGKRHSFEKKRLRKGENNRPRDD